MMQKEKIPGQSDSTNVFEGAQFETHQFSYSDPVTREELHGEREVATWDGEAGLTHERRERTVRWQVLDRENRPHYSSERNFQKFSNGRIEANKETTQFANGDTRTVEVKRDEQGNELEGTENWNGKLTYSQHKRYNRQGNLVSLEQEFYYRDTGRFVERRVFHATPDGILEQSVYEQDGKEVAGPRQLRPAWYTGYKGYLEYGGYLLL